jgi:hypothetical protein
MADRADSANRDRANTTSKENVEKKNVVIAATKITMTQLPILLQQQNSAPALCSCKPPAGRRAAAAAANFCSAAAAAAAAPAAALEHRKRCVCGLSRVRKHVQPRCRCGRNKALQQRAVATAGA